MTDEEMPGLGITELAALADVTPRTVRYYVAEGLLPPPHGSGQQRVYTAEHVARLKAIRYLKDAFLPLSEIRQRLEKMTPDDIARLIEEGPPPAPSSALDYLAAVMPEALPRRLRELQSTTVPPPATPAAAPRPDQPEDSRSVQPSPTLFSQIARRISPKAAEASVAKPESDTTWRRIVLAPDVELHYQPQGDRGREGTIERIIQFAAKVLNELPPKRR